MKRHDDISPTNYNKNRYCQMLIDDQKLSASEAISELRFWYNVYKKLPKHERWKRSVMSYNAGWNYKSGRNYYNKIRWWINFFKAHPQLYR
jgi:hypothetical protein